MADVVWWILGSGLLMSALALVGSTTLLLERKHLQRLIRPLVALAAGSLLGGALFHLIPKAFATADHALSVPTWIAIGFAIFLVIEQLLHWHHCHRDEQACRGIQHKPSGYLVLIGDGLHNLVGGLAVAGAFLVDIRLGIIAWLVAAAHEVPQELGDFGVLVHSGWSRTKALTWNVASGLTFLVGGLIAYSASTRFDVGFLLPLAAGNFLYIAAVDLVPEINHHPRGDRNIENFLSFMAGLTALGALAYALH